MSDIVSKEVIEQFFDAAESGNQQELTDILKNHPILLNQRNKDNKNALFLAIFSENFDCVKMLVSQGIDINVSDLGGWTPLHEAAYNGTIEMLTLLLSHGADINAQDCWGHTPLHGAARDGWDDYVQLLLDYNADPLIKDIEGRNAFDVAKLGNNKKLIKLLKNYIKNK